MDQRHTRLDALEQQMHAIDTATARSCSGPHNEMCMSSILHRRGTILGLILLFWGGLSWGQLPAGNDISDGGGNTGGGTGALTSNTSGALNTAYGTGALESNTSGALNTAYGNGALFGNTTGRRNTASGFGALMNNTTSFDNTASGAAALFRNTSGSGNTASGADALQNNTTGERNTASGAAALLNSTTGSDNIALGVLAGRNLTDGSANIYLSHPGEATESNTMRLGEDQTRTFIAGITGTPMTAGASQVVITSTGQLGVRPSAARYKHDIEPLGTYSQGLGQLRPVTFRYRQDPQGARQYGLIAEEVATVYPELVIRTATGEVESVQYEALIPLLLNELQHQQQQTAELHAQNAALAARLERLEAAAARATALTSR
jgi:hypothetical protein